MRPICCDTCTLSMWPLPYTLGGSRTQSPWLVVSVMLLQYSTGLAIILQSVNMFLVITIVYRTLVRPCKTGSSFPCHPFGGYLLE